MDTQHTFPSQVLLMVGVALEELLRSEAETDLARIRTLIANAQSTLTELHSLAAGAAQEIERAAADSAGAVRPPGAKS